ncbi:hypothetical protein J7J84_04035 [bacterium]|nr:hypothetical protein [bacterium]
MAEKSPADLIREAMEHLDQPTTPSEIVRYVSKRYPKIDESKIRSQVTICCVNMPTRVSFPENHKPRVADNPELDCLYRVDFGQYVSYDPEQHGYWEISEVNGELAVRKTEAKPSGAKPDKDKAAPVKEKAPEPKISSKAEPVAAPGEKAEAEPAQAAAPREPAKPHPPAKARPAQAPEKEKIARKQDKEAEPEMDIHKALASNLSEVEDGLKPLTGDPVAGKFPAKLTDADFLAQGRDGALVIVKVFDSPPGQQVVTDLLVNLGWAHEQMKERKVRAIILSPEIPDELRFATRTVPDIKIMTYEYKLVFSAVG